MPIHVPVLLEEICYWLAPQAGQLLVDGTLGGGGHARQLAESVQPDGWLVAIDRDPQAVAQVETWPTATKSRVRVAVANYADMPEILSEMNVDKVDGIMLDLGLSSDQLADSERGFSFGSQGSLDLRYNPLEGEPAFRLLERLSERHLADLIYQFGEERQSRKIARRIVETRQRTPIRTAADLVQVISRAVGGPSPHHRIHPATRTFQALRIAVNEELKWLEIALRRLPDLLGAEGRLVVISFHSLEDRLVKRAFRNDARLENLTKKPIRPSQDEVTVNPRSRSARLRVAQRRTQDPTKTK